MRLAIHSKHSETKQFRHLFAHKAYQIHVNAEVMVVADVGDDYSSMRNRQRPSDPHDNVHVHVRVVDQR